MKEALVELVSSVFEKMYKMDLQTRSLITFDNHVTPSWIHNSRLLWQVRACEFTVPFCYFN